MHNIIFWERLTFLGDTVVLLPVAVGILLWLGAGHAWRMAAAWSILFFGGLTLVAATKIAFAGWGIGIYSLDFTGISGHAMRATAVIPVMLYLMLQKMPSVFRMIAVLAGFALGIAIAVSRVIVNAHSVSEAMAGAMLGAVISIVFFAMMSGLPKPLAHRWIILLSMAGVLSTSHAQPTPTNRWINGLALYLSGHEKPYDRESWRRANSGKLINALI